jgi:hypothetical protein
MRYPSHIFSESDRSKTKAGTALCRWQGTGHSWQQIASGGVSRRYAVQDTLPSTQPFAFWPYLSQSNPLSKKVVETKMRVLNFCTTSS